MLYNKIIRVIVKNISVILCLYYCPFITYFSRGYCSQRKGKCQHRSQCHRLVPSGRLALRCRRDRSVCSFHSISWRRCYGRAGFHRSAVLSRSSCPSCIVRIQSRSRPELHIKARLVWNASLRNMDEQELPQH